MSLIDWLKKRDPLVPRKKVVDVLAVDLKTQRIQTRIQMLKQELESVDPDCASCKTIIDMKIKGYQRRLGLIE